MRNSTEGLLLQESRRRKDTEKRSEALSLTWLGETGNGTVFREGKYDIIWGMFSYRGENGLLTELSRNHKKHRELE